MNALIVRTIVNGLEIRSELHTISGAFMRLECGVILPGLDHHKSIPTKDLLKHFDTARLRIFREQFDCVRGLSRLDIHIRRNIHHIETFYCAFSVARPPRRMFCTA